MDDELGTTPSPVELLGYLRSHGWQEQEADDVAATWTRPSDIEQQPYEILVPLNERLRDFTRLVRDAIHTLQVAEERPARAIVDDMVLVSADVVRAISKRGGNDSETIPFVDAPRMLADLNEMFLAAACAAINPRPVYRARKALKALEYMKGLQLGQTERGSYVLRVISPVSPQLQPAGVAQNATPTVPFERRVTTMLADSLVVAKQGAMRAVASGNMDYFQQNVDRGISANLCRSLGALASDSAVRAIGLSVHWAPTRPIVGAPLSPSVFFEREMLEAISEAGRILTETAPEPGFELHGHVIRLDKFPDELSGVVHVLGDVEYRHAHRRIVLTLSGPDYQTAIKAHAEGTPVTCVGELKKEGRTYRLENPAGFRFDSDEDLDDE